MKILNVFLLMKVAKRTLSLSFGSRIPLYNRQFRRFSNSPAEDVANRRIFCNVELNAESIEAVGFDMDYTLAQVCFQNMGFEST